VLADVVRPVEFDGQAIAVSASTGITTSDIGYSTPDEVIRDADRAMYRAKATQVGSARLFDRSLRDDGLTLSAAPGSSD
jgi:predicted signal transduction protein with EAL and GGDEF domain